VHDVVGIYSTVFHANSLSFLFSPLSDERAICMHALNLIRVVHIFEQNAVRVVHKFSRAHAVTGRTMLQLQLLQYS
jgi:hypothetical protein